MPNLHHVNIHSFIHSFVLVVNKYGSIISCSYSLKATGAQQWEAGSAGQVADPFEGAWPQSSHFLSNGSDAGYPC